MRRVRLALPSASLCVLVACSVDAPSDEGLFISDAGQPFKRSETQDPATAGQDMPSSSQPGARACSSPDLFSARVAPRFVRDCVRCHDGTKGKATQLLNLSSLRSGDGLLACQAALSQTDAVDPAISPILSFVDPGNPSTQHDFKYATSAEFAVYRADVLAWLLAE